jgi:hypothetical protein
MEAAISFWNVWKLPPDYKASGTRRLCYLESQPWEPLISPIGEMEAVGKDGQCWETGSGDTILEEVAGSGGGVRCLRNWGRFRTIGRNCPGGRCTQDELSGNRSSESSWCSAVTQATGSVARLPVITVCIVSWSFVIVNGLLSHFLFIFCFCLLPSSSLLSVLIRFYATFLTYFCLSFQFLQYSFLCSSFLNSYFPISFLFFHNF